MIDIIYSLLAVLLMLVLVMIALVSLAAFLIPVIGILSEIRRNRHG